MHQSTAFLIGTGITALASLMAVVYLKPGFEKILSELCGSRERAVFWVASGNLVIVLSPLFFAMNFQPGDGQCGTIFFDIARQVKWGIFGLIGTVSVIGLTVKSYIPKPLTANAPHDVK